MPRGGYRKHAGRAKVGSELLRVWVQSSTIDALRAEAERRRQPNQKRLEIGRVIDELVQQLPSA